MLLSLGHCGVLAGSVTRTHFTCSSWFISHRCCITAHSAPAAVIIIIFFLQSCHTEARRLNISVCVGFIFNTARWMCGLALYKARSVHASRLRYTRCPHQRMQFWAGRLRAHLSLWQARLPVSGLVAWFSAPGSGPLLCPRCLVTVRSPLWFMQIGRQGLVGQERYVITPSLGQRAITSQQRQSRCQDISRRRLDCIRTRRNTMWDLIWNVSEWPDSRRKC